MKSSTKDILKKGKIRVRFYNGYKKQETPRAVLLGGQEIPIEAVISRERILDARSGKTQEVFTCRMEGETVRLSGDESGNWSLIFLPREKKSIDS